MGTGKNLKLGGEKITSGGGWMEELLAGIGYKYNLGDVRLTFGIGSKFKRGMMRNNSWGG